MPFVPSSPLSPGQVAYLVTTRPWPRLPPSALSWPPSGTLCCTQPSWPPLPLQPIWLRATTLSCLFFHLPHCSCLLVPPVPYLGDHPVSAVCLLARRAAVGGCGPLRSPGPHSGPSAPNSEGASVCCLEGPGQTPLSTPTGPALLPPGLLQPRCQGGGSSTHQRPIHSWLCACCHRGAWPCRLTELKAGQCHSAVVTWHTALSSLGPLCKGLLYSG